MYLSLTSLRKVPLAKWELRERKQCEAKGEVYLRGGLDSLVAEEENWEEEDRNRENQGTPTAVAESLEDRVNVSLMDPYDPLRQESEEPVSQRETEMLCDLASNLDNRNGYRRHS
ncbi:hypothetical protein BC829DRAFT_416287 [Chytridium lagenaria]|nr:hypothetical protein BC829DRAFT_424207 [Chytridium lagenaria]KAI8828578.1 hypothetical protein BC829DRAFT_424163 [Chytridium lagenaria]KAI8829419.1 hypothetical protein BC829DRAFT_423966 [Chytridium lagenaria]KAI8846247.1 hypothetical protein BC829DRAFT_419352 [Chytridium lagenaria]KAI8850238.1 hypothetical protein BC829DRAFT_416287 [Chytridium lagenaria]